MQDSRQQTRATFPRLVTEHADAGHIADTAVSTWRDVDAALSPIIGQRGVAALYRRSLYLTCADYSWLVVGDAEPLPGDFASLRATLSQQSSVNAAAANQALLRTFCDLLTKLIGAALTDRLLRSVWVNASSEQATQDT